jgi:hypothetical protein
MKLKRFFLRGAQLVVAVSFALGGLLQNPVARVSAARTFYVSRNGNNADGLSWATAWNELSRINWSTVAAGDTILVDGGSVACPSLGPGYNCGMVYNSSLSISKNGSSGAPITIRLAPDAGRNGTVIVDGGLTAWSRCAEYTSEPTPPATPNGAGVRDTGIGLNSSQWIVIDGTKWGGIEVRNHTRYGLSLGAGQHVTARYLKIHHNTDPSDTTNNSVGVTQSWNSQYNKVARSEIFRNGQDAVRGAGDYFTLEESYVHDHYCNHPDGIQSFVPTNNADVPDNEGEVRGLVVRNNIFDKIGMQTIFLGENATHNSWNVDVTIIGNLFLNNDYVIKSKHGRSRNWTISNNTIVNARDFAVEWCCSTPGAQVPMAFSNNIVMNVKPGNTAFYLPTGSGNTSIANNCLYNTGGLSGNYTQSGTITNDPLLVNSSLGNYALASTSPCAGKGASVTSVNQLLSLTGGSAPVPTNPPPAATATYVAPTATRPPATATNAAPTATQPPATTVPGTTSVLSFAPAADAYVEAAYPSRNNGLSTIIRTLASPEQRTYLRFNVAGLAGRPVVQAVLHVYANGSSTSGLRVVQVPDNLWLETGITYNNKPATGSQITTYGAYGGSAWVSMDVTSYINHDGIFSLALLTSSTKAVSYPSREAGSNVPQLVLTLGPAAGAVSPTQPPPTATTVPPTVTSVPPTVTSVPPTATNVPPTATSVPPTPTAVVPVGPATLTLAPAADAYVDAGSPDANFGLTALLRTDASPEQRTYLRFNVAGVAGRRVTQAVLRIYANGSSKVGFWIEKVTDNLWAENLITYNNRPRTNGEIARTGAHNHAVWVTVDVTSYITGDGIYTLALLTDSTKPVGYPSREGSANPPQLVLTVSP